MAREEPQTWFTSLMGLLFDPDGLRESFGRQDGRKAPGVDGIRKDDYGQGVAARLTDLPERIRRLGYQPTPVRRTSIPKGDGRHRPLGVPSFEDRLVQDRLSQILQAIWEPEFCDCSYGFRPERGAHDALRRIAQVITNGRTQWVVEADIPNFDQGLLRPSLGCPLNALPGTSHRRSQLPADRAALPEGRHHGRRDVYGE